MTRSKFELPDDFMVEFRKSYELDGNKFVVEVEYKGMTGAAPSHGMCTWFFAILVNGNRVVTGPFQWDPSDRTLNNENVCNHLASFWGYNSVIKDAQTVPYKPPAELHPIVQQCVELMFKDPMFTDGHTDYDIVSHHVGKKDWSVIITPNHEPERMYMFNSMGPERYVSMWVYLRSYARQYAPFKQS